MITSTPPSAAAPLAAPLALFPEQGYVMLPRRLLADLRDSPVAVAVYALVGRLYRIHHQPIPLSPKDLVAYDPAITYGAASRAFDRLASSGWLLATRPTHGKIAYRPTWGVVAGEVRPWDLHAPSLDCPRHLSTLRLDQRLFDTCIGRLDPHPVHAALIEGYLSSPLLTLRDIGSYALCVAGILTPTPALLHLGLLRNDQVRPLPADGVLLALASQRALWEDNGITITPKGLARLGIPVEPPAAEVDSSVPLFFVPPGMIGSMIGSMIGPMIGSMIGSDDSRQASPSASERPKQSLEKHTSRSHGIMVHGDHGKKGVPPPTPQTDEATDGGGIVSQHILITNTDPAEQIHKATQGETPNHSVACELLMSINVLPQVVHELAGCPVEVVQAAIDDAVSRPNVRDVPAWVVHVLRNARNHSWQIGRRPAIELAEEQRVAALAQWASQEAEAQRAGDDGAMSGIVALAGDACADGACAGSDAAWECEAAATERVEVEDLAALLAAALRLRLSRHHWPLIERLTVVHDGAGRATLACRSPIDYNSVLRSIQPLLGAVAAELGLDHVGVLLCGKPERADPPETPLPCPAWVAPERWHDLPDVVRAALGNSSLLPDGTLAGISSTLLRLLDRYHGSLLAELLQAAQAPKARSVASA